MIKVEKGNVAIHGTPQVVLAELTVLVHALHYDVFIDNAGNTPEESKEKILRSVERGFASKEEINREAVKNAGEVFAELMDKLKDFLQGEGDKK